MFPEQKDGDLPSVTANKFFLVSLCNESSNNFAEQTAQCFRWQAIWIGDGLRKLSIWM